MIRASGTTTAPASTTTTAEPTTTTTAEASTTTTTASGISQVGSITSATGDGVDPLDTASRTIGTGSNKLLVACIGFYDGAGSRTVSSVTRDPGGDHEQSFTMLTDSRIKNSEYNSEIWYLKEPTSGDAGIIRVDFSTDSCYSAVVVTEWENVNQTTPMSGGATAYGDSTTPSVNISSVANAIVIDSVFAHANGSSGAAGTNQTELYDEAPPTAGHSYVSIENGDTTVTMSWTITGTAWVTSGGSINPL